MPNLRNERIGADQQRRELDRLQQLNEMHQEGRREDSRLSARIESFELAYRMQMEAPDAFDIGRESALTKRLAWPVGTRSERVVPARRLMHG
jgi:hypothetical protein